MRVFYHQEAVVCDPNPHTVYGMYDATAVHIYPVKSAGDVRGTLQTGTYFYFIYTHNETCLVSQPECLHLCPLFKSPILWAR